MAEETTIALKVEIGGQEKVIKNLQELKAARKELTNAFIKGDQDAAKQLAILEDKMDDLKDASKSVKGEGLEPLRSSFSLFKDGITNFDMGKIGMAFKGLGAAMKAVPIFLLVEGITYLITNFKELSEGTGILAKVLKPIGEIIGWITDGLYALTDAIGLTNTALDEMGEQTVKNAEASKEALSQQNAEYDRQIKVAKAAGQSTVELEKAKQQAIIDTNVQIVKQIEAFVRAGGVLDDEKKKLLTASLESIKNAQTDIEVIDLDRLNKEKERREKAAKEAQDRKEKEKAEDKKEKEKAEAKKEKEKEEKLQAQRDLYASMMAIYKEGQDELKAQAKEADDNFKDTLNKQAEGIVENGKKRQAAAKEENDQDLALYKERMQQKRDIEAKSIQATQALTDLYFAHQLRQAKGNADREREIKKKQFNMNKAFGITMAVIDGVRSVQAALTQTPPLSYVLAALNAVLAVANVAKIASAKFDDGGGSAGGGADIGGGTGISGGSAPAIAQPSNTVTKIDDNGEIKKAKEETPTVKAVVVETDITDKQKRVNTIQEAASI